MTSKMGTTGGSLREMLKLPEYHNPDPLVRLIGKANESSAVVEGVPITCLIDSGSCMSARSISKKKWVVENFITTGKSTVWI